MTIDADFLTIETNIEKRTLCSPIQEGNSWNWEGIAINMPSKVYLKVKDADKDHKVPFNKIPICGYYKLEILKFDHPLHLIIINITTGKTYESGIDAADIDPSPVIPPPDDLPPIKDEELIGVYNGGYFNPNLNDFIPIPRIPATYEIYVLGGGHKSNIFTLQVLKH